MNKDRWKVETAEKGRGAVGAEGCNDVALSSTLCGSHFVVFQQTIITHAARLNPHLPLAPVCVYE